MLPELLLRASQVAHLPMQETYETRVQSLDGEDPLEEGTATHCSILSWRISWTGEPGRLQSIELHRVGHDLSDLARMHLCYGLYSQALY